MEELEQRIARIEKYLAKEKPSEARPCCEWMKIRYDSLKRPELIGGWYRMKYCPNCGRKLGG